MAEPKEGATLSINPFAAVSDYPSMLNKIAWFTLVTATGCVVLLASQIDIIGRLVVESPLTVKISGMDIPFVVLVVAFLVALASRVAKLHDRLSDLLGIRSRFDVDAILKPLSDGVGVFLNPADLERAKGQQRGLMDKVFYKYASSTTPVIDRHYVTMALDQWSWYWALLEAAFLLLITSVLLVVAGRITAGIVTGLGVVTTAGLLSFIRRTCVDYARDEVREILRDQQRRQAIAAVFRAL